MHWIGGDPGNLEVYGWAAWSPDGWVITLRNPSADAQTFALNLRIALELPPGSPDSYSAHQVFFQAAPETISTKESKQIALKPFEVRVLEWTK